MDGVGLFKEIVVFSGLVASDLFLGKQKSGTNEEHLHAAEDWLKLAHDKSPDDGVSYGYSIRGGWRPSHVFP